MRFSLVALAFIASVANAEVFFKEQFNDEGWKDRWTVPSSWKSKSDMGEWVQTAGKWHGDDANDMGVQTSEDAKFYGMSAALTSTIDNTGKDLVIQYSVKHEQSIDCGGAYIKLLPGGDKFDAAKFGGDTEYSIMFGPDICGQTKRTHVILNYEPKGDNTLITKDIPCEKDQVSHLYTLVLKSDNTFDVLVDNKSVRSGTLEDAFDLLPPKKIKDPEQSKPKDWVDESEIEDPESVKPDGYDDIPPEIPDPDAVKPEDWDDEEDGEWEGNMIDNPDYDGPWEPKMIPNPDYKGPWVHPEIDNPDYAPDDKLHAVCGKGCTHVGFELWQVKAGTIFDDIIVTDSLEEAQKFAEETFFAKKDQEKIMYDEVKEQERKEQEANMPDDSSDDPGFDMDDLEGMDDMGDEF
eukprot:CAMPEP_0195515162 /NCGR_PEP_ID=MMETSP0794_2-20130614/6323_1 /TAXON_ID=515487 /ORGANISM="Stephanopyxis turris, Strain CCMP 815" /LENGTH=405 /DNA_ID=CAMNT_0040643545 /DNA_START=84 /DNA_END=1301 /DNA_ORIENTATION=+